MKKPSKNQRTNQRINQRTSQRTNQGTAKSNNESKSPKQTPNLIAWRYYLVLVGMATFLVILIIRTAYIQVIEPDALIEQADMRSLRTKLTLTSRGIIYDRTGEELAVSVPVQAVWADPKIIFDNDELNPDKIDRWEALANVLRIDATQLIDKVKRSKGRRFIYLQRQVSPAMAKYIRELKIKGIGLKDESRRFYPTGEVSAHLVGVTGIDGHGLEGIERRYDATLEGVEGKRTIRKDAYGNVVENVSSEDQKPGSPIQLTIDQRLQAISYRAIKQAVADFRATSGTAVLIDIKTGDILAMVNAPSYNPNNPNDRLSFQMRNRAITDSIEPGSTVKPFVVLAGLEHEKIQPDEIINTGNGFMAVGGSRVRDSSALGKASLERILQKSSNVGVAKIALKMDVQDLLATYQGMGMGELSGITIPGEVTGIFPNRTRWSDFERATLAFGYGLSVTPLQLAHSYATLGNMGEKVALRLVKGNPPAHAPRRYVSEENARLVVNMLEKVTQRGGTATKAQVPGYRIGAKTGTSRKATAGGYSDQYVGLTAGVAPISDPRLALVVVINEPQGDQYYGGSVAGPVFAEIMKGALQILNVPPDAHTAP